MKEMIKTLYTVAKEDPKEFWGGLLFMVVLFGGLWLTLWVNAIINGLY